jgi:hypothetical protein
VFFGSTSLVGSTGKDLLFFFVGQQFKRSFTAAEFQALIILHELGHVMNGLPTHLRSDGTVDTVASIANSQKVVDICFK